MANEIPRSVANAIGLLPEDRETVRALLDLYYRKLTRNKLRDRYYEMHHKPRDLGISVPPNLRGWRRSSAGPRRRSTRSRIARSSTASSPATVP